MTEVNKGLAGGVSFPELTALPDGLEPDCITVAYGTNDWRLHPNDAGYEHYFNNLWARMRPILEG